MSNYSFVNIYDYFINLDNNNQIIHIFTILIIIIILGNIDKISTQLLISIIIIFVIFMLFYQNKKRINNDIKFIKKINGSLNLKNFKYILDDLDVNLIYYNIIKYRNIDKYSFTNSLIDTNKYLEIYNDIKNKNNNYAQLLDIAFEKKDSAINHLIALSNSISPSLGINNENNTIVQNPLENVLFININELKYIFDKYWFEMLNISRQIYETTPININSKPILYDMNTPNPNVKNDVFDIMYGNINI